MIECLANNDEIDRQELSDATWFKDGRVSPNVDFNDWYSTHEQAVFAGKTLVNWTNEAERMGVGWKCPF
ncbi:hypothetical protein ACQP1K_03135 [Sphaerimonospora sp. CA-214678]|uniref:hypothetical protein n=1 Tax=Sphaerimonospora sp. CA-214678 TaxID=3240029 RepID=UPI003D8B7BFF